MAGEPPTIAGLGPPIPQAGLDTVLRAWSGQGQLWEGLSAVAGELAERDWKAKDIRRRANRVLLSLLIPLFAPMAHSGPSVDRVASRPEHPQEGSQRDANIRYFLVRVAQARVASKSFCRPFSRSHSRYSASNLLPLDPRQPIACRERRTLC